jgi:hypothetical protein
MYTSCLYFAPYIPVISPFEEWKKPKANHLVCKEQLYLVKILQKDHPIYNKEIVLMYGFELINMQQINKIPHSVLAYIELITLPIYDIRKYIDKLYSADCKISSDLTKGIPNQAIGKTGK